MKTLVRFTETKRRNSTGRIEYLIAMSDRARPVARIRRLPNSRWYYVTCSLLPKAQSSHYARRLPAARRLAYTLITHGEARHA
jgi:hypothetical protein